MYPLLWGVPREATCRDIPPSCKMPETDAKKRRRQPTKLTIKSRPVNEAHPREWGETVKVPKAKFDALVEEYKRLHDENWKYENAAIRTANANKARRKVQQREIESIARMLGKKPGRPDRAVPFVSKENYETEGKRNQAALHALYRVAPGKELRGRCLGIVPVLKLVGNGYLWKPHPHHGGASSCRSPSCALPLPARRHASEGELPSH